MCNFLKQVTVEPSFFIYSLLFDWLEGFNSNLFLQKSCRYNASVEPDLNTKCDDEAAGVLFISDVNSKYRFAAALFTNFVTIFSSTWSDKAGRRRRPLIYLAISGQIFVSISGCLQSYFWHWTPTAAVISSTIFESLSGGAYLMIVACQMYLCDESDPENRTMKLGINGALRLICVIFGRGGSGIILRRIGFFKSYFLCLILALISLICGLIFIKDNSVQVEEKFRFYEIFNVKRTLLGNFKVVFNKNLGLRRVVVSLLIFINIAVGFTIAGEMSVLYQYLRYRFEMDEEKYSVFSFYRFSVATLGMLFLSVFLSKYLKIHDGLIGILAGFFDLSAIMLLMFASQVWQIFMVASLDLFQGCVAVITVSFMSKYYQSNELGRLNAVNGVLSLVFPFTFPMYNAIFKANLNSFPSAFCVPSVVIDSAIIICFCVSYFYSKKIDAEKPTSVEEETEMIATT